MANRDYPLAPTYPKVPGKPAKRSTANFNPSPVKKDSMPKKMNNPAVENVKYENVLDDYKTKAISSKAKTQKGTEDMRSSRGPSKKSM
jgi:hypothetical protein